MPKGGKAKRNQKKKSKKGKGKATANGKTTKPKGHVGQKDLPSVNSSSSSSPSASTSSLSASAKGRTLGKVQQRRCWFATLPEVTFPFNYSWMKN